MWRRWAGAVLVVYLVVRAPAVTDVGDQAFFDGVGAFWWASMPLEIPALRILWGTAVVSIAALAWGLAPRVTGPVAAIAGLLILSHRSSLGQILWFDTVPALHLLVIAVTASLLAVDAERIAGWGLRLGALVTVATYAVSGVTKLRVSGIDWVDAPALDRHIAFSAARAESLGGRPSPLVDWLPNLGVSSTLLAVVVLALELAAPLALVGRRSAVIWSVLIWLMHATIAATMFVVFHWPLTGAALVPVVLAATTATDDRS